MCSNDTDELLAILILLFNKIYIIFLNSDQSNKKKYQSYITEGLYNIKGASHNAKILIKHFLFLVLIMITNTLLISKSILQTMM